MGNLRTVLTVSAAGVAAALLFAACNGPDPVVTDSPSAIPSATASSTPSPSPTGPLTTEELLALLPEGADMPDVQGAIITAEFFVELYGEMLRSGDTRVWDALSGPECEFCADSSRTALRFFETGTKVEGGEVFVDSSRTRARLNDDGYTYVGVVLSQDEVVTTKDGSTPTMAAEAGQYGLAMQMTLEDGRWTVLHAQIVEPEEIA